ncbi:unnamed protein product, partial [Polarella glacialis]
AGNPALLDSRGFFHGRPATNVQGSGAAASRPWCPSSQASATSSGTGPSAADSFGASAYAGAASSAAPGTLGPSRSLHGSRREGASGSLSGTGRRTGSSALLMAGASASVSRHRGPGGLGAPTSPSSAPRVAAALAALMGVASSLGGPRADTAMLSTSRRGPSFCTSVSPQDAGASRNTDWLCHMASALKGPSPQRRRGQRFERTE